MNASHFAGEKWHVERRIDAFEVLQILPEELVVRIFRA
jgi:hypothetical protein